MKWLSVPVRKWGLRILASTVLTVAMIFFFIQGAMSSVDSNTATVDHNAVTVKTYRQIGFYDLMSQRKEIYDIQLRWLNQTWQSTITSPDDNRIVLKGKIEFVSKKGQSLLYSYTPIYQDLPGNKMMISELNDLFTYAGIWMERIELNGEVIAIGQNGIGVLYKVP
jgi:hypothetical protein